MLFCKSRLIFFAAFGIQANSNPDVTQLFRAGTAAVPERQISFVAQNVGRLVLAPLPLHRESSSNGNVAMAMFLLSAASSVYNSPGQSSQGFNREKRGEMTRREAKTKLLLPTSSVTDPVIQRTMNDNPTFPENFSSYFEFVLVNVNIYDRMMEINLHKSTDVI